jgi:replicative DNA helicase
MLTKEGDEPKESSDFAQISGGLRRASKNQNVAIIVGSQLNRDVEKRNDKKPIMADIRNSGAFEQDAARIIGLYRDEVYNEISEKPNVLELIFLKNRFGKNGISLEYNYDLEKQAILAQGITSTA